MSQSDRNVKLLKGSKTVEGKIKGSIPVKENILETYKIRENH